MKTFFLSLCLISMFAIGSPAHSQSLENPWGYSFNDIGVGKQIIFGAALNVGTDGSVAFVITRGDGGAGPLESKIFWVKAKVDGTDPTEPLWTSDWQARGDIVAVRRNHLVYYRGRELRSVTIDASGNANESSVKFFSGDEEGGDPLTFSGEQAARAPGFVYSLVVHKDKLGFTLDAFRFVPGPPEVSAVPTFSSVSGNFLSISFHGESGGQYQLQSSTALEATNWQNVGVGILGKGSIQTVTHPVGELRLFFKIKPIR
jgi:hypothetical protein